jgi:hypothetical protein
VRPLRVAFAGDAARFAAWVPSDPPPRGSAIERIRLVDTRGVEPGEVAEALRAARPDAIVALGVAELEAEALADQTAPVLGVVVPAERPPVWAVRAAPPGGEPPTAVLDAAAVAERARIWTPGSPGQACDRLVALDPVDAVGGRLWRTIAPPVDDRLFRPVQRAHRPARIVYAGPSTEHREWWLATAKHVHDVRHVAHGITPARLPRLLGETDVSLAAHPTERRTFDHRVALGLAAGHLVVTEPLAPRHGLEPGLDLLEVEEPDALARVLGAIRTAPDTFHRIRIRGRLKAERFRASHVWGRVITDLLHDVG